MCDNRTRWSIAFCMTTLFGSQIAAAGLSPITDQTRTPHRPQLIEFDRDSDAANRIVAADLLRSLSQEIPAAVCHLHQGISVAEARGLLQHSVETFDRVANALLHGDESLGVIGSEARPRIVMELEALIKDWAPIRDASLTVLAQPDNAEAAQAIYDSNEVMYDKTYKFLAHLEGQYANGSELLASDMMLLEVVGRMAVTNQRLAYDACQVWSHDADAAHIAEDLLKTMSIYENSLTALSVGMPSMGIEPPPSKVISEKLDEIGDHWKEIHDKLIVVSTGVEISIEDREWLYHELAVKLHAIEELERLYENHAKRIY